MIFVEASKSTAEQRECSTAASIRPCRPFETTGLVLPCPNPLK